MYEKLDELYYNFYGEIDLSETENKIEAEKEKLIQNISEEDKKGLLNILNELESLLHYKCKDSFIQGFKLGIELTNELNNYDYNIIEKLK